MNLTHLLRKQIKKTQLRDIFQLTRVAVLLCSCVWTPDCYAHTSQWKVAEQIAISEVSVCMCVCVSQEGYFSLYMYWGAALEVWVGPWRIIHWRRKTWPHRGWAREHGWQCMYIYVCVSLSCVNVPAMLSDWQGWAVVANAKCAIHLGVAQTIFL